jgi:hypothetical protein
MNKVVSMLSGMAVLTSIALFVSQTPSAQEQTPPAEEELPGEEALVCYTWSAFPNERLKLNIKRHSPLSEAPEEKHFDHPPQIAYGVHGKEIGGCGGNTMGTVTGTIVTAKEGGAHMGLMIHFSRGEGRFFGNDFCRSITFDCTTKEDNPAPNTWSCHSRNEFDVYHGVSTLRKVDERQDPRCSVFENGSFEGVAPQSLTAPTGSAGMPGAAAIPPSSAAPAGPALGRVEGVLPQLRLQFGRRLTEEEACYFGCRGAGAHDLICRFFCGLRPFTIGGLLIPD